MKKLTSLLTIAGLALCMSARAQTNAPTLTSWITEGGSLLSSATNWAVIAGAGRSTTGNKDIAFTAIAYNFNPNVGLVAGYDWLWSGSTHTANAVKGGITLSATIHPFAFIGSTFLTNVVGTPFVADLIATPQSGNAIGNIIDTGINFDVYSIKNFELVAGLNWENRQGQGMWDGSYAMAHVGLSRNF